MPKTYYTLASMLAERKALGKKLNKSKTNIAADWDSLFTPPKADNKVQLWVNQAERILAMYDGIMLGYKLIQRIAGRFSPFRKRKKKK